MESNMSTLKRRLNQAIGECRSQASVTARRLVKSGSRGSLAAAFGHSTGPTAAATATGAMGLARATVAPLGHSRHQHRPIYSYSFEELPDDYQQQQFSGAAPTIGADYHSSWTRIADGRAPSTGGDPLQVCQSQLFNGNEFKPNECHFRQTIQAKNQLRVTTSTTTTTKNMASQQNNLAHAHQQQQQTANITSHQEHYAALTSELVIEHHKLLANSSDNHHHPHQHHSHYDLNQSEFSIHDTSSIITSSQHGDNEHGHDLQSNLDDSQQYSRGEALNTTTDNHINDDANNDQSVSSGHRQYFIRSSFNASIRTRRSRRSSRRILRQSGRHTSTPWRQLRHVRFQPVPQAIDISITSSNGFEHQDDSPSNSNAQDTLQTSDENNPMDRHHRLKAKVQQQLTRFCRKSRIQFTGVKPKFSAKPLQHLPGHIKSSFGKIKLKTLNNLASQLQNTLTHHHHNQQSGRQQSLDIGGDTTSGNNNTQQTKLTLPIQRTFHLRNSAATAKHQITLSINNQKVISPADLEKLRSRVIFDSDCENNTDQQQQSHQSNDDDGWGSDFDESQSTTGADETTLNSITGAGGGSYLLEIGKPSCDTRAICDVIQDQGISGQFKRLHDVSCIDHPPPSPQAAEPEPESTTTGNHSDGDDDDDEADQGYDNRWQRVETCREDKLELITDGEVVTSIEQRQLDDKSGQSEVVNELSSLLSQQQSSAPKQRVVSSNQIDDDHDEENVVDPAEGEDDDAAEEEAELRSLEARQNFKQVRDKLKLILEQRLASYERDLKATRPHPASGASSSTTTTTTTSTTTAPAAIPVTSSKPAEQKTLVPANKSSERVTSSRVPPSSSSSAPKPPPPPPLPRKPTFVAGFNSHKQLVVTSQHRPTVHVNHDHFDCQSNCSEASSLSSGGLDSNHSGSQDSGHSTQHSADDGGRSTTTTTTRASRTVKLHHHKQQQQQTSISPTHSSDSSSPSTPAGGAAVIVVVANHHCVTGTQSESAAEQQQQQQALSSTAATTRYPLDAATRMRLLEQQRQMSVKLKQKPRRRTAKRALNLECSSLAPSSSSASPPSSASSACNGSLDNQSISTSTSGEPTESTTTTCSYPHHHLIGGVPSSAKSALSLRELIKEVIDNSEKPGKISRLTRSILTRSDSLSSSQEDEGSAAGCRGETGEISSSTASDQEKP